MIKKLPEKEALPNPGAYAMDNRYKINELVEWANDITFDRTRHDIEVCFEDGSPATIVGFGTSEVGPLIVRIKR